MDSAQTPEDKSREELQTSLEQYLRMNENEKDAEIQKAIGRLQKRIQEILYLLEKDPMSGQTRLHPQHGKEQQPDDYQK